MRTITIALFASCVVSFAETNTDNSGYVTNANLLAPFTLTNSSGNVVTDAVLVKLTPNKFIYKTSSGSMGILRLDSLSKKLQEKFGYDSLAAQAADDADKQKQARQKQYDQQQQENAVARAAQNAIWKQVEANRDSFSRTGDSLKVEQVSKKGVLASYNFDDIERSPVSLTFFVKDSPSQTARIDGATISGPFYKIGTYTYTSVMGASKTIECLTRSPQMAFNYYRVQAGVEVNRAKDMAQQQLDQQRQEAAVPQATRDIVWQKVQAHETNFVGGGLMVRQITTEGIMASFDVESDEPGRSYSVSYFVKNYPKKESLSEGGDVINPFYEIGTYTYTSVMGANKTIQCLTSSPHIAFQYYLNH